MNEDDTYPGIAQDKAVKLPMKPPERTVKDMMMMKVLDLDQSLKYRPRLSNTSG